MKVLIFALVVLAAVNAERDWSKVKYREINPFTRKINTWAESRVVGGEEAVPNSLPYQAGLFIDATDGTYFCGGSLISTKYVVTAAHCIDVKGFSQVEVILGAHNIREEEATQVRMVSTTVKVHAAWISILLLNDIAMITLPSQAELNENIKLIGLPTHSDVGNDFSDQTAKVSGWGKDSDEATGISTVLRFVDSLIITNDKCNENYLGIIGDGHICSSGTGNVGACSGDSGGPLVVGGDVLVGIVSFGISLGCEIGWPSAYTRTTNYLDWIARNSDVIIAP